MSRQTAEEEQAAKTAAQFEKLPLIAEILARLAKELPANLTFHTCAHARDVLQEAVLFATIEKRLSREMELIAIAAAYHDAGFLTKSEEHEALGADMAAEAMRRHNGYRQEEIELVRRMILDTKLVYSVSKVQRNASSELSGYLLDADMSNFGRDDFFERLDALCREQKLVQADLYKQTLTLMEHHRWFTQAAAKGRQPKKEENVAALKSLVAAAK